MSQNKTIIPGVDYSQSQSDDVSAFYRRSTSSSAPMAGKTYVPDMYRSVSQEIEREEMPQEAAPLVLQQRAIVGVLFSISRTSMGEMFPLYVGRNTIGSDETCDVCLREETVSPQHALLLVRADSSGVAGEESLTASITDSGSDFGTMVDEVIVDYDRVQCADHAVITVGNSYRLLLCLFDANRHELSLSEGFAHIRKQEVAALPQQDGAAQQPAVAASGAPAQADDYDAAAFYAPSSRQTVDHSLNKTIVL